MSNLVRRDPSDLQEIRLRPSPRWSKAVIWALIGTASFAFVFALLAKIDEVVVAQGDLEPAGAVKPIKASSVRGLMNRQIPVRLEGII